MLPTRPWSLTIFFVYFARVASPRAAPGLLSAIGDEIVGDKFVICNHHVQILFYARCIIVDLDQALEGVKQGAATSHWPPIGP